MYWTELGQYVLNRADGSNYVNNHRFDSLRAFLECRIFIEWFYAWDLPHPCYWVGLLIPDAVAIVAMVDENTNPIKW